MLYFGGVATFLLQGTLVPWLLMKVENPSEVVSAVFPHSNQDQGWDSKAMGFEKSYATASQENPAFTPGIYHFTPFLRVCKRRV